MRISIQRFSILILTVFALVGHSTVSLAQEGEFVGWTITKEGEDAWGTPPSDLEPAYVDNFCPGSDISTCFISISGRITDEVVKQLKDNFSEGHRVVLNSSGGDLKAGMELGRIIRSRQYRTEIGSTDILLYNGNQIGNEAYEGDVGVCYSACAYAFLGGIDRSLGGGQLGIHRFSLSGKDLPGEGGLFAGQKISAVIVDYLLEMNIEPKIFTVASQTPSNELFYIGEEDLGSVSLKLPRGFGEFSLDTYRNGIVAVSKRLSSIADGDAVQLIGFCLGNQIAFKVVGNYEDLEIGILEGPEIRWEFDDISRMKRIFYGETLWWDNGQPTVPDFYVDPVWINNDSVEGTVPMFDSNGYIVFIDNKYAEAILSVSMVEVEVSRPNSVGGPMSAKRELNDKDRANLSAAFRNCID